MLCSLYCCLNLLLKLKVMRRQPAVLPAQNAAYRRQMYLGIALVSGIITDQTRAVLPAARL